MKKLIIKPRCSDVLEHYQCQLCPFATHFIVEIREHRKICNLDIFSAINPILDKDVCSMSLESYQCNNCEFSTMFLVDLQKHMCKFITVRVDLYEVHSEKGKVIMLKKEWKKNERMHCDVYSNAKINLRRRFKCDLCVYQTLRKSHLDSHFINRHTLSTERLLKSKHCEYKVKTRSFPTKQKDNKLTYAARRANRFICNACNYRAINKSSLKKHIKCRHLKPIQVVKCSECDFMTTSHCYLKSHEEKMMHGPNQIKRHQCQHCDYKTVQANDLRIHIGIKHTVGDQIEWFQCNQCDYQAKERVSLLSHKSTQHHDGNIPLFQCEHCPFQTVLKFLLKNHIRANHNPDDRFTCEQCDFRTKYTGSLFLHVLRKHKSQEIVTQ